MILGSSLTAMDAIVALDESGHKGKIFIISRNGLLPWVQNTSETQATLSIFTPEKIKEELKRLEKGRHKSPQVILRLLKQMLRLEILGRPNSKELHWDRFGKGPTTLADMNLAISIAKEGNPIQEVLS